MFMCYALGTDALTQDTSDDFNGYFWLSIGILHSHKRRCRYLPYRGVARVVRMLRPPGATEFNGRHNKYVK